MEKEINLSENIKKLFEIEYLDSMADVQRDVTNIFKEFIRNVRKDMKGLNGEKALNLILEKRAGKDLI